MYKYTNAFINSGKEMCLGNVGRMAGAGNAERILI
jgi:hypothetical protein